jgi:crossover junction endodeoxyribonuclease RuvC
MKTYIGIDPGITGAVAFLTDDGEIEIVDTPTYQDGNRTRIDAAHCSNILNDLILSDGVNVFIEKSQPMPRDGCVQSFGTGYSFGLWVGILAALEIPYTLITPQAWKKAMMPGEAKEKDASRIVARRLWPQQTEQYLSRKKDHGRADALLMAEYGRRLMAGAK